MTDYTSAANVRAVVFDFIDQLPPLPDRLAEEIARIGAVDSMNSPNGGQFAGHYDETKPADLNAVAFPGEPPAIAVEIIRFMDDVFVFDRGHQVMGQDRRRHWKHGLEIGLAAAWIAGSVWRLDRTEAAIIAGLFHDVGRLLLTQLMPKAYARIRRQCDVRRIPLRTIERNEWGVDHDEAGARICQRWDLHDAIYEAVVERGSETGDAFQPKMNFDWSTVIRLAHDLLRVDATRQQSTAIESLGQRWSVPTDRLADVSAELASTVDNWLQEFWDGQTPDSFGRHARPAAHGFRAHSIRPTSDESNERQRAVTAAAKLLKTTAHGGLNSQLAEAIARCVSSSWGASPVVAYVYDAAETVIYWGTSSYTEHLRGAIHLSPGAIPPSHGAIPLSHGAIPLTEATPFPMRSPDSGFDPTTFDHFHSPLPTEIRDRFARLFAGRASTVWPLVDQGRVTGGIWLGKKSAGKTRPLESDAATQLLLAVVHRTIEGAKLYDEVVERRAEAVHFMAAHADEKKSESRSQALAIVASMAAGAAHELNTPLAIISGRAQLLRAKVSEPEILDALAIMDEQARQGSRIVSELLAYCKPDRPKTVSVTLKSWLGAHSDGWRSRLSTAGMTFQLAIADGRLAVGVDERQFVTILDALMANAAQACSAPNGMVVINSASLPSDDRIVMTVSDNGSGMSPDVLIRATDPFFSHRTAGRGRGMGLSIAQRLAEINGGRLWIESAPEQGTTVFVELPSARYSPREY